MAEDAFSGASAVGQYWQARCVGFDVYSARGRRIGTVERLERGPGEALIVRRGHRKPVRVSQSTVSVIDPWQRTLWVLPAAKQRTSQVWARRAVATTCAGATRVQRLGPPARRSIAAAGTLAAVELPRLVPPAKRTGRRVGYRAALLSAFVLWLYSVVVYAVVRVCVRVLLVATKLAARAAVFLYACTASLTNAAIAAVNARRLSSHA